jgi:molybdopterin/thiamine biosynthesis adenylyltransferase
MEECHILIAGCGLGSIIAECALRLGFIHFTIIDGDKVELSNLNRQNYVQNDIGKYKVDALYNRLLSINPGIRINVISKYLTEDNIGNIITPYYDIAINTIDFASNMPFVFDEKCFELGIPVLHPLNLGWGASLFVIGNESQKLKTLHPDYRDFEVHMVKHILKKTELEKRTPDYLKKVLDEYIAVKDQSPSPPQLTVGSMMVASVCCSVIYKLWFEEKVKTFPDFYFEYT